MRNEDTDPLSRSDWERESYIKMSDSYQLPWQEPNWMEQAYEWIQAQTAHHSIGITGPIEQPHLYPWSTVLHVPVKDGKLFFKATAPETLYEAALTQKLAHWFPENLPEFVAVDMEQGWMLMRDSGEQLRASIRPTQDIKPWRPVIIRYAEMQIGLAEHIDEILRLGIPDHRPEILPDLYSDLLADEEILMIGQEKGISPSEHQRLLAMAPRFEQTCSELAAAGIPSSLDHGDFHDGNILLKNGRITFFDWGDASVSHPFVTLRTFFVSIETSLNLDDYAFTPEMASLLDSYLEPWQIFASGDKLLDVFRLSESVASVAKALSWRQTVSRLDGPLREQYAWIVPEVLREFLHHMK